MNRKLLDSIFVLVLFGIVYMVIVRDVAITGHVVSLPEFGPGENAELPDRLLEPGYSEKSYFVELSGSMNIDIRSLGAGNSVYLRGGGSTYSILVLRVQQSYSTGVEQASLLVSPGNKRITLSEGDETAVDLNNDGSYDIVLALRSVSAGKAGLNIRDASRKLP